MQSKKAIPAHQSKKSNVVAQPSQSPASRRAAESQLKSLITKFSPNHSSLIAATRKSLRKRLPTAHEVIYEYRDCFVISISPSGKGYQGVLAIRGSTEGVKLYFNQGKQLQDPEKLLKGSASQVRFIELETTATLKRPAVASLIEAAIANSPVPFASSDATGSVIIQTSAAKKTTTRTIGKKDIRSSR